MSRPQTPNRGRRARAKEWLKSVIRCHSEPPVNRSASQPANPARIDQTGGGIINNQPRPDTSNSPPLIASNPSPEAGGTTPSIPTHDASGAEQPSGSSVKDAPPLGTSNGPRRSGLDKAKDRAVVVWSFVQLLLMKAPDVVSMDPVTVVFGVAKVVLELSQGMQDNMDATDHRISTTLSLLYAIESAVKDWKGGSPDEIRAMKSFETILRDELTKLVAIKTQSKGRQFALQEEDKQKIVEIFDRVNAARERLMLATGLRVHMIAVGMDQSLARLLKEQLNPSRIADYYCDLEGKEAQVMRRVICTPGTRRGILSGFEWWANRGSHSFYWLLGPAGTGKSTIARTITRRFELNSVPEDSIVLGANFFCSRLSSETSYVARIVPTIVYQLSNKCKAFANALHQHRDSWKIDRGPTDQLQTLLVEPWEHSQNARKASNDPIYLVGIDAVDELEGERGSEVIGALLDVQEHLQGLKFFITSREDPALVAHAQSLGDGSVCRLQEVSPKEADEDLRTYLVEQLGRVATDAQIDRIVKDAAGLFIYASTVVEQVVGARRSVAEQKVQLKKVLKASIYRGTTTTLDNLYLQILTEGLNDPEPDIFQHRLCILHTFLCAIERTSPFVVTHLLNDPSHDDDAHVVTGFSGTQETVDDSAANGVVERLHAVLYRQNGQVMWFHKSFLDFVFDQERSTQRFYCDRGSHHRLLVEGCFRIMQQLRFNIADISTSFVFNRHNPMLQDVVDRNVSAALSYASRNWSQHLIVAPLVNPASIIQSLHNFLQLPVLFWIETMNLLDQRRRCDRMLHEARKWMASSKEFSMLAQHLGDAASFAFYFSASAAALSTPHLYLSALSTFPNPTSLRTTWRKHFGGIPTFMNAIQGAGGSPLLSLMVKSDVYAVAVSPDSLWVATGSRDGLVRVWDLSTGEELKILKGHNRSVLSVAFSQDSKHIVSGSDDKMVWVWDVSSGEELQVLQGHNDQVSSVVFSQDGARIVSGSHDETVRVWDVSSGKELKVLKGHSSFVHAVAFSQDGTCIVSGSSDKTVRVWDALTGDELRTLRGHSDQVCSVAFSQDGGRIVSGSRDCTLRIWDASSGEELKVLKGHNEWVSSVAFSHDDTCIVSGSWDYSVRVWDASSGKMLKIRQSHTSWVTSVAFLQDGARIVSGSYDGTAQVWDAASGQELETLERPQIESAAFSHDGAQIVSGSRDGKVCMWDALSGEELKVFEGHSGSVDSVAISKDGTRIVSGSHDRTVRVWDASSGEELKILQGRNHVVTSVALSTDGTRIVSASYDNTVQVWDALSGEELMVLNGPSGIYQVGSVALSHDGKQIASAGADGTVRVWDAPSGEELKMLDVPSERKVTSVAFSTDGRRIVFGVYGKTDHTVHVWDAWSGEELKILKGHKKGVTSVAFSPDGMQIVSGSYDKTVRLWDASSGKQLRIFQGHSDSVTSVAFATDGTRIVSSSHDSTVRVWRVATSTLVDRYIQKTTPEGDHTGWLLSPDIPSAYLMFVPPSEHLPDDSNILTIPHQLASHVDFSKAKLGADWSQCYTYYRSC